MDLSSKRIVVKIEKREILSAIAINEEEIALSWDRSIQIANTLDATSDGFTKDSDDITASSMLNSEGFITGDADGRVRAWIIGFTSPVLQPQPSPAEIIAALPLKGLEVIHEGEENS